MTKFKSFFLYYLIYVITMTLLNLSFEFLSLKSLLAVLGSGLIFAFVILKINNKKNNNEENNF